jgi:drug/metabolite transporter (DMT)-like permease
MLSSRPTPEPKDPLTSSNHRLLPLLLLGGAILFWGTSFAAIKVAMVSFTPMTVMWLRMAVAALVFLPFWWRVPRPEYRPGDWKLLALAALFIPCVYYTAEGFAVQLTTSGQAGVISATVPLLVAGGAWVLFRERLTWQGAVAIGLSLAGVAVLSMWGGAVQSAPNPALGDLLELLAMVAAAGSMLTIKHLSTRYDPWWLTGMQATVGAVFFLPMALASGPRTWLAASPQAWLCVAYLGTFVSLAAFGLYNSALRAMPASRAALSINAIPAVALLAGWVALGETLNVVQIAASAVIIGAVVFGQLGGAEAEEPQAGEAALAARETP